MPELFSRSLEDFHPAKNVEHASDSLTCHLEINAVSQPNIAVYFIHIAITGVEGTEPTDWNMPCRSEHMRAMRRVLALILAELPVGRPCSLLRDQTGTQPLKGVGEGDRGFENSQT
jgi:hypothetical protein